RKAPGTYRVDQALTNSVVASACSSFTVDWTYYDGVGFADPDNDSTTNNFYAGMSVDSMREQPWFGLSDSLFAGLTSYPARGVGRLSELAYQNMVAPGYFVPPITVLPLPAGINAFPNNIESFNLNTQFIKDYWAVFGYNQDR